MNIEQAKELLNRCTREGLDDYAFGDSERGWWLDGEHIAEGYFGGSRNAASVTFLKENITFMDDEARKLKFCGTRGSILRNDTVGEYGRPVW